MDARQATNSRITLTGLVVYGPNDKARPRRALTLGNVPLPDNLAQPTKSLVLLYGKRDRLLETSRRIQEFGRQGLLCASVTVKVPVDAIEPGVITAARLQRVQFANLRRITAEARQKLVDEMNSRLAKDQSRSKIQNGWEVGNRPDILESVLKDSFPQLKVFTITIPDGSIRRPVAIVLDWRKAAIEQSALLPFKVLLPRFRKI